MKTGRNRGKHRKTAEIWENIEKQGKHKKTGGNKRKHRKIAEIWENRKTGESIEKQRKYGKTEKQGKQENWGKQEKT